MQELEMTAREREEFRSKIAEEVVNILRERECSYRDAKAALNVAASMLEQAMLRTRI